MKFKKEKIRNINFGLNISDLGLVSVGDDKFFDELRVLKAVDE